MNSKSDAEGGQVTLPSARVAPIDEFDALVGLLQRASGEDTSTILRRMRKESRRIGANVMDEVGERGIPPFIWTEALIDFYRESHAFLYDSLVWNAADLKCEMREWIGTVLQHHLPTGARILTYGDGLGFDAVYLAQMGYQLTYFEVSEKCRVFANEVALRNSVELFNVSDESELPENSFDAIVCLDVLEHTPDPPAVVRKFAHWLQPSGWLVVSAPFYFISPTRPTHLKSNRRFSGNWRAVYGKSGFRPFTTRAFWNPIVFSLGNPAVRLWDRLNILANGTLLTGGRFWCRPYCAVADWMARANPTWARRLDDFHRQWEHSPEDPQPATSAE